MPLFADQLSNALVPGDAGARGTRARGILNPAATDRAAILLRTCLRPPPSRDAG